MLPRRVLEGALLATLVACSRSPSAASPAPLAASTAALVVFDNVRILTMDEGRVIESGRVVVDGTTISAVVDAADTDSPPGAVVIDGTGMTLLPGLADMHVHYGDVGESCLYVANSITTVRNLWGTERHFRYDALAKSGEIIGPHVVTAAPLMDGPKPVWGEASIRITSPQMAVGAVESQRASGYPAVKLYEGLSEEAYRAAVSAAQERQLQVWTHVPRAMTVQQVLELGVDSIEHFDDYAAAVASDGLSPTNQRFPANEQWASASDDKIAAIARLTKDNGVWNAPTLALLHKRFEAMGDVDALLARPEMAYVSTPLKQWWSRSLQWMPRTAPFAAKAAPRQLALVAALHERGAGLLIGTDSPNPYLVPGFAIHDELEAFRQAGLDRAEVLRIATVQAARFLDDPTFGRVRPDLRADLVLVEGDPRQDLGVLRDPVGVMVNGHYRDRAALKASLRNYADALATSEPSP
ncbi:MAG: amidohydrolase family protein [Myxococcales bacterium]|nr:amidohydrolase family protein [Myxococcales bacterium]